MQEILYVVFVQLFGYRFLLDFMFYKGFKLNSFIDF